MSQISPLIRVNVFHLRCLCVIISGFIPACAQTEAVVRKPLPSSVVSHKYQKLDADLIQEAINFNEKDPYQVGPGDALLVAVYGHPELALSTYTGNVGDNPRSSGMLIDNDGSIQFPLIGTVNVQGKTTAELRVFLQRELARYIEAPKVTVQVAFAGSIRYHLLGQFTSPGLKFADRPMRLMQALSLGGSVQLESASLRSAYVARGKRRLPVNFLRLLRHGDMSQNIVLRSGDVVMVPDSASDRVFVFGGVVGERVGGAVPFVNGRLDILQALAQAGFGFRERSQGVLSKTRVIRSEGDRGELFVVDVERILKGGAAPFFLVPGDVIFVPTTRITNWNLAIQQILPSLQVASALLNPFVQIQFLRDSNR
ncbi:MAG: polysaccharide biosynthesis/export family protein [Myxococcales bacterium]|nr:polysaccharide biosynthesis/export family protein [Myxococcales bacterium]